MALTMCCIGKGEANGSGMVTSGESAMATAAKMAVNATFRVVTAFSLRMFNVPFTFTAYLEQMGA